MKSNPLHITFILLPRFNMLTLTALIEPMRIANYLAPNALYEWDMRSPEPGRVTASNGLYAEAGALDGVPGVDPEGATPAQPELVVLLGSWGAEHYRSAALFNWLRRLARAGVRIVGVELGVYALANAGLLAGRRATTHWSCRAGFAESFPNIEVCEQLYTIDGNIMTCAGGTAGLDLMLHLVSEQHGEALGAEVAKQILHHPRRPPEGMQRYAAGAVKDDLHPDVRRALALLEAGIEEPLSVSQLCQKLKVSQRQLERLFRRDTGCTIVQFSTLLRLQYARVLLTSTPMSIRDVSASCGFNSMSYFSLCFLKMFGKKPSKYRLMWPADEPAPQWPGTVYSFIQSSAGQKIRH